MGLTIDLVPHMAAGDRERWQGDQNDRPLSDLGWRQARAFAGAFAGVQLDAVYAGRALRCQQSLEPLAERAGLSVTVLPELGEDVAWRKLAGWSAGPHEAPFAAGSCMRAIDTLRTLHPEGRIVACSHGHVIPAVIAYLAGFYGRDDVPSLDHRGQWYRLRLLGLTIDVELVEAAAGFPL